MNPADINLALALLDIFTKAGAAWKQLQDDKPEVYEHIAQHHADTLAAAMEAAKTP